MSWSEGRSSEKSTEPVEKRLEKLGYVNGILSKLVTDEDLHDELKTKAVKVAINHWTGKKRLPPEEAHKFQESRACVYVLQRLQMLQHASQMAGIASPLDHMIDRKNKLDIGLVVKFFGSDIIESSSFPKDLYAKDIADLIIKQKESNQMESKVTTVKTTKNENTETILEKDSTLPQSSKSSSSIWTNILWQSVIILVVSLMIYFVMESVFPSSNVKDTTYNQIR